MTAAQAVGFARRRGGAKRPRPFSSCRARSGIHLLPDRPEPFGSRGDAEALRRTVTKSDREESGQWDGVRRASCAGARPSSRRVSVAEPVHVTGFTPGRLLSQLWVRAETRRAQRGASSQGFRSEGKWGQLPFSRGDWCGGGRQPRNGNCPLFAASFSAAGKEGWIPDRVRDDGEGSNRPRRRRGSSTSPSGTAPGSRAAARRRSRRRGGI